MTTAVPRHDLFAAGPSGPARAIGRALATHRTVIAAVLVWALAFVALGAVIIGLGLLLTHVLLPAGLGPRTRAGADGSYRSERRR